MSGTLASFCLMAIGARELSGQIDTFQILFVRSVVGLIAVSVVMLFTGRRSLFATRRLPLHLLRNGFHFGGQYGWFLGIGLLPLAEVFALEFTVPLWTALIAALFLKEKLNPRKLLAIGFGLLGVLVIVQPGVALIDTASFIVLGAALCYAVAHSATKALSSTEAPLTILFYMCVIQLPIGLCFSWLRWVDPGGVQWAWLVAIGMLALSAHYCMTKAMQTAEVTAVVTMDFLRLPLIALIGVVLYAESFEAALIVGACLMLVGNLLNASALKKRYLR